MKVKFLSVIIIFSILPLLAQTNDNEDITVAELREHVFYLASESLAGRKPGTEGGRLAAEYIRANINSDNIILQGEDGFQYFDVVKSTSLGDANNFSFGDFTGNLTTDYTPFAISGNATLSAPVSFVGYGLVVENDSLDWNDYKDVDVTDKWTMILLGIPDYSDSLNPFEQYASLRKKLLVAKDNGAAGVLFVSGEGYDKNDELIKLTYKQREPQTDIPVLHIKRYVADSILASGDITISSLENHYNNEGTPFSFDIDIIIDATVDLVKEKAKTQNVLAILPGSDTNLKNEYIVIGAHYDHLGFGGPGSGSRMPDTSAIHFGADDNASGVAAIMEIIEKLSAHQNEIKRSVIFVAFGAEEMGLLGSKYFVNNPIVSLTQIEHMFNLDMVGRLDTVSKDITVGGVGTAIGFKEIIEEYAKNSILNVKLSPEGLGPSDHASFYAKDIPVSFVFTGTHTDYHTPRDVPEKINYEGEKVIADFIYGLVLKIANLPEPLTFQEAGPKEQESHHRRFKVTLGIMPDVASSDIKGVRVDGVTTGRPADNAGMKKGDIIVALDGKPINNIYEYMERLSNFEVGQQITVEVIRNDERIVLLVVL